VEPFIGTIMPVGFAFAPKGWALCDGQLLAINTNQALFALIGTWFGGDGIRTFGLPDLRGRSPVGLSNDPGQMRGSETVTLTIEQMAAHSHAFEATTAAGPGGRPGQATGKLFGASPTAPTIYGQGANPVALAPVNIGTAGGNQPHANMQPYLTVNFIIALVGIFPSRS
jgi:microcystin-dependent protein